MLDYLLGALNTALDFPDTIWIAAIVAGTLFIRAAIGFGDGLIAVPLLSFFMDIQQAVPFVLLIASAMSLLSFYLDRQQVQLSSLRRAGLAAIVGFPIGVFFLSSASPDLIKVGLGVALVMLASWQLWGSTQFTLKGSYWSYVFGLLAGVLGGAYSLRGVVFAVYGGLRNWSPAQFKSTIHSFYIITGLFIPIVYALSGLVNQYVIGLFLLMLPVALIATYLGAHLTGNLDSERFKQLIWWFLMGLGGLFVLQFVAFS